MLPKIRQFSQPHFSRYIEPFCSSASSFFEIVPRQAVLSDINGELVETVRAVQLWPDTVNSDKQNAKLEHDKALNRVELELLSDNTGLFKQFSDIPNFKRWLTDVVFDATYPGTKQSVVPPEGSSA